MTILDQIEKSNKEACINELVFAQLNEFSAFMQSFQELDYPANVIVPFQLNGNVNGNVTKETFPIQGWVVKHLLQDTNNYRTAEIEREHIAPMRQLAKDFIMSLINSPLVDPEAGNISYTIKAEYAFLSQHLFGVSYTINFPTTGIAC